MKAFHHALAGILLYCFGVALALAQQQILVPTRPPGDSTNAAASTAFVTNALPIVNVLSFGAVGNGVTNDTPAINNAIAAGAGGVVVFPHGLNYAIGAQLSVGNGTSSSVSTTQGTVLLGMGNPTSIAVFGPFQQTTGPLLTWIGGTNANVIGIRGPLMGWGVNNLKINCGSAANLTGLNVQSAQFGDSSNLTFINCFQGIVSQTVHLFDSVTITDSFHNYYRNTTVIMPSLAGSMGILLTGPSTGASDSNTDFNQFVNTTIEVPTTASTVAYGLYVQQTDTNQFFDTHIFGGNNSSIGVVLDYATTNTWPASNSFYGIDVSTGNGAGTFLNNGSPGAGARPNYIYGFGESNGGTCPNIANLTAYCSHQVVLANGGTSGNVNIVAATTGLTVTGSTASDLTLGSNGGFSGAMFLNGSTSGQAQVFVNSTASIGVQAQANQSVVLIDGSNGTVFQTVGTGGTVAVSIGATAGTTGNPAILNTFGSDTNSNLELQGKGTGGALVHGIGTNTAAPAGYIGELISATQSTPQNLTVGTAINTTSISLTAGDWDVSGICQFPNTNNVSSTTANGVFICSLSTTSATPDGTDLRDATYLFPTTATAPAAIPRYVVGASQFSFNATTTVFLVSEFSGGGTITFGSGTNIQATGTIRARRMHKRYRSGRGRYAARHSTPGRLADRRVKVYRVHWLQKDEYQGGAAKFAGRRSRLD